jgi:hypothetical protein
MSTAWGVAAGAWGIIAVQAIHSALFPTGESMDIGLKFNDRAEASQRREFGVLSKDQLDQAVSKAVDQYMATGLTKPVIVYLPPRPAATPAPH